MYESQLVQILTSHLFIPHDVTGSVSFFLGTFEEAVAQAKHEYKFLLVYLHRLGNPEADNFLYFSFLNPNVVNLMNDPDNMLIWAGHLSSEEGKDVSCLFNIHESSSANVTEYLFNPLLKLFEYPNAPFLLSFLTITMINGGTKMSVIGQLEQYKDALEFSMLLEKWIQIGSRPRLVAKREKASREANTDLRKIQEIAFNNMLEQDMIKEALQQSEIEKTTSLMNMKIELRNTLNEMENELRSPVSKSTSVISLLIKMPNGRRFDWKFSMNSSTKFLYYLVYCQEDAPEDFELLWNYPQRVLNCKPRLPVIPSLNLKPQTDDPQSFEQLGVLKNEIILVRDVDL